MSSVHETALDEPALVPTIGNMPLARKTMAKRLEMTREALELNAAELCRAIKCKPNRWSQYESGERPVTLPIAIALRDTFSIPLDWTFCADPRGLPDKVKEYLSERAVA